MIPRTYIERNVSALTKQFNRASNSLMTVLYAKAVIIEVGGWVELSMDDLVKRAGKPLKDNQNIKFLAETIIRRNHGFDYTDHFRPMLMKVIGLARLEKLENSLDGAKHAKMKAALGNLKIARNQVAHTYIKNAHLGTIAAPSLTQSYLQDIYDGLKDIEKKMKSMQLIR